MKQLGVIHPRMLGRLTPLAYATTCTIQTWTETRATNGAIIRTPVNLADHVNLPCRLSPAGGTETPSPAQIYLKSLFTISLAGYYPAITEKMQAVVDGSNYDITAVDNDGQSRQTRLSAKLVT